MKIGILGGGQLARMIALSGYPLAQQFIILDPSRDAGAVKLGEHLQGQYDDPALLAELAQRADVVTYEFENVPASAAKYLTEHTVIYPPAKALEVSQDRLIEKNFLHDLDIETAPFAAVNNLQELRQAMQSIAYPAILKSRRFGYDGKGQVRLNCENDLEAAWEAMQNAPSIVEGFVPFEREISIIAVRSPSNEIAFYPVSENQHRGGILRVAQCRHNDPAQQLAEKYAADLIKALDYVGVIALEMFEVNGQLLANEFAPRVHNSGHWSIEGAVSSQFENHLRAILDLPLGSTQANGYSAMVNFIGNNPNPTQVLAIPNAHLHCYDKSSRKSRKVAHATICSHDKTLFEQSLQQLIQLAEECDDS